MVQSTWYMTPIRAVCFMIDEMIYSLMRYVFEGILQIADIRASNELINDIISRIYVILGIYMVFKLSIIFFSYIIDPDQMSSKEKSVGKVIANTVVMLAMLVMLPMLLFGHGVEGSKGLLYEAQDALLPMIPRIILGQEGAYEPSDAAEQAEQMAASAFSAFFKRAPDAFDNASALKKCNNANVADYPETFSTFDEYRARVNQTCKVANYGDHYVYNYSWILSGIVGIVMVVILVGILMDVAKRVFKMLILQMIAPVPIMSYIDPKSAKDGAFAQWVKNLTSTFLDIFFKLGIVYLVIFLIGKLATGEVLENADASSINWLTNIVLIVGLLLFAKEAPKFIKESLGIKDKKDGGGMMGKMAGALGGGAAGYAGALAHGGGVLGSLGQAASMAKVGAENAGSGKPIGAFGKASDATVQAITGDKDRKAGMAAWMNRKSLQHMGRREGATDDVATAAQKDMYAAQDESRQVQEKYKFDSENGVFSAANVTIVDYNKANSGAGYKGRNDWGTQAGDDEIIAEAKRVTAVNNVNIAASNAAKAESQHKKISTRVDQTGNSPTANETFKANNSGSRRKMYDKSYEKKPYDDRF